jgi:hypothetical protein
MTETRDPRTAAYEEGGEALVQHFPEIDDDGKIVCSCEDEDVAASDEPRAWHEHAAKEVCEYAQHHMFEVTEDSYGYRDLRTVEESDGGFEKLLELIAAVDDQAERQLAKTLGMDDFVYQMSGTRLRNRIARLMAYCVESGGGHTDYYLKHSDEPTDS